MIRQLREAKDEIAKLKREELVGKNKLRDLMDMYRENFKQAKFIAKRFRPLHMQLKSLYKQNVSYQGQIRGLKMELQPFKEDLSKINLNVLAQDATRRSSRLRK
jgi:uncharacterized protein (DUF3084 family)